MARETKAQWLERQFEFEYCAECHGDAQHHTVVPVPGIGNWFALCKYPPSKETNWEIHPVIKAFQLEVNHA